MSIEITALGALGPRRLATIRTLPTAQWSPWERTHRLTKLVFRVPSPAPGESIYRLIARVAAAAAEVDER